MNLLIIDTVNKEFHPYMQVNEKIEMFIRGNIIKINRKYNSYFEVHMDEEIRFWEDQGYKMNQGLFDKLIIDYNSDLREGEQRLDLWVRDWD